MRHVAIIGTGGHARVVEDIIRQQASTAPEINFAGFVAETREYSGPNMVGTDRDLSELFRNGRITHVVLGMGATTGNPTVRQRLQEQIDELGIEFHTAIHPTAIIASDAEIGHGSTVMAGAVLNTGAKIGKHAIINTGAIIDHDCLISDHVHIAPGVVLSGNVQIGTGTLIGVGATCKHGVSIGEHVTIGAGAVIVGNISSNVTAVGVPAKPMRL